MDPFLPGLLRARCTSGPYSEREIVCKAADEIERLRTVMADALRIMECVPESGSDHRPIEAVRKEMRAALTDGSMTAPKENQSDAPS